MPEPEYAVAKFYAPIMQEHSTEVQKLLIRVLGGDLVQANELVEAIVAVAERSGSGEGGQ